MICKITTNGGKWEMYEVFKRNGVSWYRQRGSLV